MWRHLLARGHRPGSWAPEGWARGLCRPSPSHLGFLFPPSTCSHQTGNLINSWQQCAPASISCPVKRGRVAAQGGSDDQHELTGHGGGRARTEAACTPPSPPSVPLSLPHFVWVFLLRPEPEARGQAKAAGAWPLLGHGREHTLHTPHTVPSPLLWMSPAAALHPLCPDISRGATPCLTCSI